MIEIVLKGAFHGIIIGKNVFFWLLFRALKTAGVVDVVNQMVCGSCGVEGNVCSKLAIWAKACPHLKREETVENYRSRELLWDRGAEVVI